MTKEYDRFIENKLSRSAPPTEKGNNNDASQEALGVRKYLDFIDSKRHTIGKFGFKPTWMPEMAFDFQKHIIDRAVRMGRAGIFADTGLGKTLIQLAIAHNVVRHTGGRALILTPLAVAFQFVDEAEKIGEIGRE